MGVINIKGLSYYIGDKGICKNIDVEFSENKFTGIIGPNGSGKSTLLKQVYRVLEPSSGAIYLSNTNISDISTKEFAKMLAVLPQENNSDFDYTVADVILMGRFPYHDIFNSGKVYEEDGKLLEECISLVGLRGSENRIFRTLSGGEKQRVLLARALITKSKVLILDEVTNHLDIGYQYKTLEILKGLGLTIIAAIHDLSLAMKFCDEVVLINGGEVVEVGNPKDIIDEKVLKNIFKINAKIIKTEEKIVIDYISSCY